MGFVLKEHITGQIIWKEDIKESFFDQDNYILTLQDTSFSLYSNLKSKEFRKGEFCYQVKLSLTDKEAMILPGYFIGIDWLVEGEKYIYVEPKLNSFSGRYFNEQTSLYEDGEIEKIEDPNNEVEDNLLKHDAVYEEINFLKMLLDVMSDNKVGNECRELVRIDWQSSFIKIKQQEDLLTPFLIVQFLQLLRQIVRKGLKKSYYKVRENLNNRVKGKILVGHHIKQNVFKNRLTKAYCEYQVFGEDNLENQFLKKILRFTSSYVENNTELFRNNQSDIEHLINYCSPAFEKVSELSNEEHLRYFKHNPFFKEYKDAIRIGQFILRRFSYNIAKTAGEIVEIPPFWIDMPKLFELYVYQKLLVANNYNTNKIKYQFSTYGNSLDILIKDGENSMVIDAKYKLQYLRGKVHQDIRQVAGYARLNKVLKEVGYMDDQNNIIVQNAVLPCLIIYPDQQAEREPGLSLSELISEDGKINAYHEVYKLGVRLPLVTTSS